MSEIVFVDTSAWFALFNKKDEHHQEVDEFIKQSRGVVYVTTNYVVDETLTLIAKKVSHAEAVKMGQTFQAGQIARVIQVTEELQQKGFDLFVRYDDKFFSFTDCTSFAVMKHLLILKALNVDSDFKKAGFISLP